MRLSTILSIVIAVAAVTATAEPNYVGVQKCSKMCHKGPAKGDQLAIWQKSKHAEAYATLATPAALEVGKKFGIAEPQKSDKCLKCHVTAFGVAPSRLDSTFKVSDGVQCEGCHGPGSDYMKLKVMKDHAASVAAGLIEPNEALCLKCHNKESPNYREFVFADMVKKIAHPKPKAEPAK